MINKRYEAIGKFQEDSSKLKLQGSSPSPEALRGSQSNLQVLGRVNDIESSEICSKNNKFDHFVDPALLFYYPD